MKISQKLRLVFALSFTTIAAFAATETFYENASSVPLSALIESAKSTLDIEIYEIKDPRIQKAILSAIDRGVKVRIVQESQSVGSSCAIFERKKLADTPECKEQKKFVNQVKTRGGLYVPFAFNVFCDSLNPRCLEHGKMAIADGAQVLLSTGNFNGSNLCGMNQTKEILGEGTCNRDYSIVSSDRDVIATLELIFESDLKSKAYDLPQILTNAKTTKLTVSPYSLDPLLAFIRSAKTSVQVENQYLKNADLNNALIDAAKRGVAVTVMVNSVCSFAPPTESEAAAWTKLFEAFDRVGVKSKAFTRSIMIAKNAGYLHAKAILVDGDRAWVGSVNGSTQALTRNREFGIFIDDQVEVKKLNSFMMLDYNAPKAETWKESLECLYDEPKI